MTPKWNQNEVSRKLFFNNNAKTEKCVWTAPAWTECIWAHPVERSGGLKIRRKVNCEQNVPGKPKGARKTQETRLPLRSRWAPRRRRFLVISPWVAPCAATGAQRSQKPVAGLIITKMWPPELQKWAQDYPKWNLNLKSETKSLWGGLSSKVYCFYYT